MACQADIRFKVVFTADLLHLINDFWSTLGGLPLTWSDAKTNDVNSWPRGIPANVTPVSSPTRLTLKLGVLFNSAFQLKF